jgi:hypothetical protein
VSVLPSFMVMETVCVLNVISTLSTPSRPDTVLLTARTHETPHVMPSMTTV